MEKFILTDGVIAMNNEQLFYTKTENQKNSTTIQLFTIISLAALVIKDVEDDATLSNFGFYLMLIVLVVAVFSYLDAIYYFLFRTKSNKKLIINEIEKVTIAMDTDQEELSHSVSLEFSNRKNKDLNFRKYENQLEPFLAAIKKRNSRVLINKEEI
ncbi:hypothetical protein [Tenacibaculum agarivorans]|uniref:hypothetical protein n=1 Tax=Tenacibaculum agarivorans TaxID=1908389 RepID=UPI00094BA251|nr:hypothetical protein [Tenacibaculum agarivorans]